MVKGSVRKILIVDDNPDFLYILSRVLGKEGHDVIQARDGPECLKKIEQEKPDIVFLDVMMPGMDGWEVCRKIKDTSPELPVSICSVLRDKKDIEESIKNAGADEHLTKPLVFNEVLRTVRSF
jgi:CheY-like chemotaxis protein